MATDCVAAEGEQTAAWQGKGLGEEEAACVVT